jgi:DNA-binding XRE family transcriptional regulator
MSPDAEKRERRKLDTKTIRSLYVDKGWSQARIAEHLGVSKWTIGSRLKRLEISPPPPRLDPETVRKLYVEKNWSPTQIAKHFEVTAEGVRYRLSQLGVRSARPRPEPDVEKIRKLYLEEGWSQQRIAKHLGISPWTVENRLKRLGVTLRPRSVLLDEAKKDAVIEKIKDLYLNQGIKIEDIARIVHVNRPTVSKLLKSEGIVVPRRPQRDLEEILHLYHDLEWTADRIAERFGCKTKAIFHAICKSGETRRSRCPPLDPAKIRELYVDQEVPLVKIAELFRVGYLTINKVLDAEGIERRTRGRRSSKRRARHYDRRLANLRVGECFHIQCLDPAPAQVYFSREAKKLNIRIATRRDSPTSLRITRYA